MVSPFKGAITELICMQTEPGMTDIQEDLTNPREEAEDIKPFKKINNNRKGLGADNPVEFWWPCGAQITEGRADNLVQGRLTEQVKGW